MDSREEQGSQGSFSLLYGFARLVSGGRGDAIFPPNQEKERRPEILACASFQNKKFKPIS